MATVAVGLALSLASPGPGCGPDENASAPGRQPSPGRPGRNPGVTDAEPTAVARATIRRSVYVPIYPFVYTADNAHPFNLAATLYIRNTDRAAAIVLTSVRLYDGGGRVVRDEVSAPRRVAPMASAEFFVRESDTTGGAAASYVVDWAAEGPVSEPVVEAVMIGTVMNQGMALMSPGRPVGPPPAPSR
jgi:hypothetical protein